MPPDPRIEWVSPEWEAQKRLMVIWRASSPEERLAQIERVDAMDLSQAQHSQVNWAALWRAERELISALHARKTWEELVPEDWEARQLFLDACEGLPPNERLALSNLARLWLDLVPYPAWIASPKGEPHTEEFMSDGLGKFNDLNDLWLRLNNLVAQLTVKVSTALSVLARLNQECFIELLKKLPPVLLWMVAAGKRDPELFLTLARSEEEVAASFGGWHYQEYLRALEAYGNKPVQQLNFFRSSRHEVGQAIALREEIRQELDERATDLVKVLSGGEHRPVLLTRLLEAAVARSDSWSDHFLGQAAGKEIGKLIRTSPDLMETVMRTLTSTKRQGPLGATLLSTDAATAEERRKWREMVLNHIATRLELLDGEHDDFGPLAFESEKATILSLGGLLATWLQEEPAAAIAWIRERFSALPVRASRQEPRYWLFGKRSAFFCVLIAEALGNMTYPTKQLVIWLADELEKRVPEWEWDSDLGRHLQDNWPSLAILASRPLLNREQRERVAAASRSVWVWVQLLDQDELTMASTELGFRLETDLHLLSDDIRESLERRLVHLGRWSELSRCRQRDEMLNSRGSRQVFNQSFSGLLDDLVKYGSLNSDALAEALRWRVKTLRDSHAHDALDTYAMLVKVLSDLTGEPEWRHALAEVHQWRQMTQDRSGL